MSGHLVRKQGSNGKEDDEETDGEGIITVVIQPGVPGLYQHIYTLYCTYYIQILTPFLVQKTTVLHNLLAFLQMCVPFLLLVPSLL